MTVGGGVALPLPQVQTEVTLPGNYQAVVAPGSPRTGAVLNETDQLRIRYEMLLAPFSVVGVGVERGVSAHVGVRAEFRSFLGVNQVRTRIDSRPISGPTSAPFTTVRAVGTPDVQVSTNPAVPTTLSLQGVDHFDSFEVKGNLATFSDRCFLAVLSASPRERSLRRFERVADLTRDGQLLGNREHAAFHTIGKRLPHDVLQDGPLRAVTSRTKLENITGWEAGSLYRRFQKLQRIQALFAQVSQS